MTRGVAELPFLVIGKGPKRQQLSKALLEASLDMSVGSVAEVRLTVNDPDLVLGTHGFGDPGTRVKIGKGEWTITNHEVRMAEQTGLIIARSPVARTMRAKVKVGSTQRVKPSAWITERVEKADGKAFIEDSSVKQSITQGRNESELSVAASLCNDMGWLWSEAYGRFMAGSGYKLCNGNDVLPEDPRRTWPLTWKKDPASDAVDLTGGLTADDKEVFGRIEVTLENNRAKPMRPLDRLELPRGFGMWGRLSGHWLIESVSRPLDNISRAQVTATRPRKTTPRSKGSFGGLDLGGLDIGDIGESGVIPGWATKIYPGCDVTPREYVARGLRNLGTGRGGGCLEWVSVQVHGSPSWGGSCPNVTWSSTSDSVKCKKGAPGSMNPPAGALVLWYSNPYGHIMISIGNGEVIGTGEGPATRRGLWSYMGPGSYYGWMLPVWHF